MMADVTFNDRCTNKKFFNVFRVPNKSGLIIAKPWPGEGRRPNIYNSVARRR
jgi:hypothetical protein